MKLNPGPRHRLFCLGRKASQSLGALFQNPMNITSADIADEIKQTRLEMLASNNRFQAYIDELNKLHEDVEA